MSNISSWKKELRKQLLTKRAALSEDYFRVKSDQIRKRVMALESVKNARAIHLYISMDERKEVSTGGIIGDLHEAGKQLVVPVMVPGNRKLKHIIIKPNTNWQTTKWGVTEPVSGEEAPADLAEVILVPAVGGDGMCNRLGYGKGFYDGFLNDSSAVKAGLMFDLQITRQIPVEPHDVPLDMIITESGVIIPSDAA